MRKIRYIKHIILLAVLILAMVYIISLPAAVFATTTNVTNENITTNVTISGTAPTVDSVLLTDADGGVLDLSADTIVVMNCSGIAGDVDGVEDLHLNATLYETSTGSAAPDDFTNHYTSASQCTETGNINSTHLNYNCAFTAIWFHANPGEWTCNVTAWDTDNMQGNNLQDTEIMAQLLAIDVDDTDLDFGNLAIGTNTGTKDYNVTVYNDGNVDLDLKVEAWGVTDGDGLTMDCDDSNISERWLRVGWNTTGVDWDNKVIVNNTGATNTTFDLAESDVTSGNASNTANTTTRWGLGIPTTETNLWYNGSGINTYNNTDAVDGDCYGTISFTALVGE